MQHATSQSKAEGLDLMHDVSALMQQAKALAGEPTERFPEIYKHLIDMKEEIVEPIPILSIEGMTICSEGNISTIVGEAKSKKTFLCSALVGGFLNRYKKAVLGSDSRPEQLVLWVDTEQSRSHVQQLNKRILALAQQDTFYNHKYLRLLALREESPENRSRLLFEAIQAWKPRLVVIDGISDLLYNTNDLEESERLVGQLMKTSSRLKNHILVVLHTNPNSDKARGHIGSALQRKSESVIFVRKMGDCSIVEPQFCRNESFDRFAFKINGEGMPERCPLPNIASQESENRTQQLCELMQELGGFTSREVLLRKLRERCDCSRRAASMRLLRAVQEGLLIEDPATKALRLSAAATPEAQQRPTQGGNTA